MLQNFQKPLQLIHNKPRSEGREGGKKTVRQPCNKQLLARKAERGKGGSFASEKEVYMQRGQQQELLRCCKGHWGHPPSAGAPAHDQWLLCWVWSPGCSKALGQVWGTWGWG